MTTRDDAPRAGVGAPARFADEALQVLAGEDVARDYLQRLHDGLAQPGELAVILAYLRGEAMHGALRLIEKALEGHRYA